MQTTNKLILGAVQLGLKYGINNTSEKPTDSEVFQILELAKQNGINTIDTANAYGNANQLIGNFNKTHTPFNVINKFSNNIKSLNQELKDLNAQRFFAYLFHKFSEFENCSEELKNNLREAKQANKIENIGVSIYSNQEFDQAIECDWIDLIQIPYNVLDNWNTKGDLILKAKSKSKIIHNRSIFLQGLLFMNEKDIPKKLTPLKAPINNLNAICKEYDILKNELCMAYSFNNANIDGVLFGIDSRMQLMQNLECLNNIGNKSIEAAIIDVNKTIKVEDDLKPLLNPVNWN